MQFKTALVSAVAAMASVSSACNCSHNSDAGRWKDTKSDPVGVVRSLLAAGGGCQNGDGQGRLCVGLQNNNAALRDCIAGYAQGQQSYHRDWFLWTAIDCSVEGSRGFVSMTLA